MAAKKGAPVYLPKRFDDLQGVVGNKNSLERTSQDTNAAFGYLFECYASKEWAVHT